MTPDVSKWSNTRLFDYLQATLGLGTFNGEPEDYLPWKMKEIGMMKRVMKHRNITPKEIVTCAEYCKATRIQPENFIGLLWQYDEAMKWKKARREVAFSQETAEALELEQERVLSGDPDASPWVDRLVRATGSKQGEVLDEWRKQRAHV